MLKGIRYKIEQRTTIDCSTVILTFGCVGQIEMSEGLYCACGIVWQYQLLEQLDAASWRHEVDPVYSQASRQYLLKQVSVKNRARAVADEMQSKPRFKSSVIVFH